MWLLLHPNAELVLAFLIMTCRPRQIALLIAVLVGLIGRDEKRSRADRAVELAYALCGRERRRDRKELPPGSSL
jgi:hypothetical protein